VDECKPLTTGGGSRGSGRGEAAWRPLPPPPSAPGGEAAGGRARSEAVVDPGGARFVRGGDSGWALALARAEVTLIAGGGGGDDEGGGFSVTINTLVQPVFTAFGVGSGSGAAGAGEGVGAGAVAGITAKWISTVVDYMSENSDGKPAAWWGGAG